MDSIDGYIISSVLGVITGVIATVLYNKMCNAKRNREEKCIRKNLKPVNLFYEYAGEKEVIPIVSFEDIKAIVIAPLFQKGKYILSADINIKNKPLTRDNRNFVMALLKYIPELNWKYYCEEGYRFKFKIRGDIKGIQIELKNNNMRKIIDEYVTVTELFEEKVFSLKGESVIWEKLEEICFTVFCEEKYICNDKGRFEIMDCRLEK